ncbi:hypothetical protein C623_0225730 [Bacillus thuringiensis serovar aizawai str. Hu4-2]|nr:hypothetical protein C623_0225730 [Bacillus thuringiensis serovar aizawai str. Hu4-2]
MTLLFVCLAAIIVLLFETYDLIVVLLRKARKC